jgi:predicted nucleic acid-binding protein
MAGASTRVVELDSNFLVAALNAVGSESNALQKWIQVGTKIQISAIAWSEYLCGPFDPDMVPFARKLVGSVESFTEEDAELASELFNRTGGRARSHVNCMIAAHAIRRQASLATLNMRDFRRFEEFDLRLA